jgi:hypothetical protein
MTDEQQRVIDEMRKEGYAITVFTPEEISDAESSNLEDIMVERGWNYINNMNNS